MTKRHIAPALFLLSILGCSIVRPTAKISPAPPIKSEAVLPAPAASDADLKQATLILARKYVLKISLKLPAWEADYLGQFERPQLADVKDDLARCYAATDEDTFLAAVQVLMGDQERLLALDQMLKTNGIL